jgi:hypothetical protein
MTDLEYLVSEYRALSSPAIPETVNEFIAFLGEYPSIEAIEEALSHYKNKLNKLRETDIPFALHGMGLESAKMSDGTEVTIARDYNIKQKDPSALAAWLESRGAGMLVKTELTFGKGDVDDALRAAIRERCDFSESSSIHPQTLKKYIREEYESEAELPPESAATVRVYDYAKIKG